jgi:type IV secretory pathway VirB3-like protein
MRRASVFHASLHRPKTVMGIEPYAFYAVAFMGSFFFASKAYVVLPLVVLAYFAARWLTKKDPQFMATFMKYIEERHAYSALPRPEDWSKRPIGWGRGLPW